MHIRAEDTDDHLCVSSVDFPATFQDWSATDPLDLFQAPTLKSESNPKVSAPCYFVFDFSFTVSVEMNVTLSLHYGCESFLSNIVLFVYY